MAEISIDYTSRDYLGIKSSLLDYASRVLPEWTSRSEGDFGVVMVELFAYQGDIQSYYIDRAAQEAFLTTATQRGSILNIAKLLGYTPHGATPATGTVRLVTAEGGQAVTVPAGTQVVTSLIPELDAPLVYETVASVVVPADGDPSSNYATVGVVHGQTRTGVALGTASGLTDQRYRLPHPSVIDGSVHVYVETASGVEEWAYVDHMVDAGPADKAYTLTSDEQQAVWVVFGDHVNGTAPPQGVAITATYRTGGGTVGNVPSGTINALADDALSGVTVATTVDGVPHTSAMVGGADAESLESIRRNAPLAYRTQRRAVTPGDFADLALSVPGVTQARAVVEHSTSVSVFITGPGGGAPSEELKDRTAEFLSARALSGTTVSVAGPALIAVNFGSGGDPLRLVVKPSYSRAGVETAVRRAITQQLGVDSVSFGMTLSCSQIYDAVQAVPGVAYWWLSLMARADSTQTAHEWITFRDYEIPTIGDITMTATGGIG